MPGESLSFSFRYSKPKDVPKYSTGFWILLPTGMITELVPIQAGIFKERYRIWVLIPLATNLLTSVHNPTTSH